MMRLIQLTMVRTAETCYIKGIKYSYFTEKVVNRKINSMKYSYLIHRSYWKYSK